MTPEQTIRIADACALIDKGEIAAGAGALLRITLELGCEPMAIIQNPDFNRICAPGHIFVAWVQSPEFDVWRGRFIRDNPELERSAPPFKFARAGEYSEENKV